jgi:hypothetical protein
MTSLTIVDRDGGVHSVLSRAAVPSKQATLIHTVQARLSPENWGLNAGGGMPCLRINQFNAAFTEVHNDQRTS